MESYATPPLRQIRAVFDDFTVRVYQAFSPEIATAAVSAGTFVPPFRHDRMTWIKPSFFWMMYRSGWATKQGQERVLAIRITRSGFEEALANACLSHFDADRYAGHDDWRRCLEVSTVRVQWDPERSPQLEPLPWRSIQIGLGGAAVRSYVSRWIVGITDITDDVHAIRRTGDAAPTESPYPLPRHIGRRIGASDS